MANTDMFGVHNLDARKINNVLTEQIVDVTITSPPYFDLKDYGYKEQIGHGQEYRQYLKDLTTVFKNVYDCTKSTGTLWVIIDTFRRDGAMVTLPFDFSAAIKETGWHLQEVIIWQKDRTVPWTHKGQMRNMFEYILVFSKSDKYNFFIDEVRDFEVLKKWWVKYPERYNPAGKAPEGIWNFDIPTQGSWGDGYIDHFCPLPEGLISQILKISTKEGDVVLDPFAGSGAVLAQADNMKRRYIGFELNKSYIKMFDTYLKKTGRDKKQTYERESKRKLSQKDFQDTILKLRALKYAKILYRKLKNVPVQRIYVDIEKGKPEKTNSLIRVIYKILMKPTKRKDAYSTQIENLHNKPPLSKYGVDPNVSIVEDPVQFIKSLPTATIYSYTRTNTHKFQRQLSSKEVSSLPHGEIILSKIKVELDEKDYE